MQPTKALAAVIRGIRASKGLSRHDVNKVDLSYFSQIERGEVKISVEVLGRVAEAFEVDVATLIVLSHSPTFEDAEANLRRVAEQLDELKDLHVFDHIAHLAAHPKLSPGRPYKVDAGEKITSAKKMREEGVSAVEIAQSLELSVATVRRYLKKPN
jgi:transcriptional regulator with XRE-family HTH domain